MEQVPTVPKKTQSREAVIECPNRIGIRHQKKKNFNLSSSADQGTCRHSGLQVVRDKKRNKRACLAV